MSKNHMDRKKLDELYMQDKKENYINFLSLLIAAILTLGILDIIIKML